MTGTAIIRADIVRTQKAMAEALTAELLKQMTKPTEGNRIIYDATVRGLGVRITKSGAKAFILNYRASGRERRFTIGSCADWTLAAARARAKDLKRQVDAGADPMAERHADRMAPTMNALADRFLVEHAAKRRPSTQRDYTALIKQHIRPAFGTMKVADLRHAQVEKLHRAVAAKTPYRANRMIAVLSKMMALSVKWELRTDNPVPGIERSPEERRERFLSGDEIRRLAGVLAARPDQASANAIRLLMLTGARRGETLMAKWSEFDLAAGVWLKPSAHTKTKKAHRVPLSAPAVELLAAWRKKVPADCPFVFPPTMKPPKDKSGKPAWAALTDIKRVWAMVCREAGMAVQVPAEKNGKPVLDKDGAPVMAWQSTARVHDLRHTYASILASSGLSLPIIGALLGHTQPGTTARYAHLLDDPLRAATERVGMIIRGEKYSIGDQQ